MVSTSERLTRERKLDLTSNATAAFAFSPRDDLDEREEEGERGGEEALPESSGKVAVHRRWEEEGENEEDVGIDGREGERG